MTSAAIRDRQPPEVHLVPSYQVRVPRPAARPVESDGADGTGGKGRPTPTRREAEAAARARAKVPRTRKEIAAAQKLARQESSSKMRSAMKTGDERYLPARDRGPVKHFIRDYVDSRFSFVELMIPVLLVTTIMAWSGNSVDGGLRQRAPLRHAAAHHARPGAAALQAASRARHPLPRRGPKGTTYYAVMRSLQMKFMRLPKSQVKIGQELPERYR